MNIFEIQPSTFEVQEGESFVIEILFKPSDNIKFEQDIIIACDNCTTIEFKSIGEGQLAVVELMENDTSNTLNESYLGFEFKDYWANRLIKFEDLNPHMLSRKKISVFNKS